MIVCVHVYVCVCVCVANGCTYMFYSLGSEGVKMVAMRRSRCDQDITQSLKAAKGRCLAIEGSQMAVV